jgi:hypothetical protein
VEGQGADSVAGGGAPVNRRLVSDRRPVAKDRLTRLLLRVGLLALLLLLRFARAAALLRLGGRFGHVTAPFDGSTCRLRLILRRTLATASPLDDDSAAISQVCGPPATASRSHSGFPDREGSGYPVAVAR